MNDFMEMHWGHGVWVRSWPELQEVTEEFIKKLDAIFYTTGLVGTPLASCFSLDGDVLSQWRAYADDGKGFSIGFQADTMADLAVRPLKVLYDEKEQLAEIKEVIEALYATERNREDKESEGFYDFCLHLMLDFAAFKNPAFHEEREVRLLHVLNLKQSGNFMKLVDPGGMEFGSPYTPKEISFFMRNGVPVPFIDMDFTSAGKVSPLKEVIIGPKNNARTTAVSAFLETIGLTNVEVKKSSASYR